MPRQGQGYKVWVEPSGTNWRTRWRGPDGTGQETFFYKVDADELAVVKARAYQRRAAGLPPLRSAGPGVTLTDWGARWLAERARNPRTNTYRMDKAAMDKFLAWAVGELGEVPVRDLTDQDLLAWKDWLYAAPRSLSSTTVRMHMAHLRVALEYARARGWAAGNPAAGLPLPPSAKPGRVLSHEEIATLLAIVPRHVGLAFTLLLNSGMRRAEVVGLRKAQVERRAPPELWRLHFEAAQTKNKKPKAVVLLPVAQAAVAEAYAASRSERVFEKVSFDVIESWMKKVRAKLGPVRPHDFKHTFCTHWMRQTGDFEGLQQITGNSAASLRIYYHLALGTPRGLAAFERSAPNWPLRPANLITEKLPNNAEI